MRESTKQKFIEVIGINLDSKNLTEDLVRSLVGTAYTNYLEAKSPVQQIAPDKQEVQEVVQPTSKEGPMEYIKITITPEMVGKTLRIIID